MTSPPLKIYNIGIICGSTRQPRAGLQITHFIHHILDKHLSSTSTSSIYNLEIIDIAAFNLPLFNEPGIPQAIEHPSEYEYEHTRTWSNHISQFDAFIFITPQYNWGIPAALKNAIDYLFNEWTGKPGMVISYGGRGGGKAAQALLTVLDGLKMKKVDRSVGLAFPDKEFRDKCFKGGELGLIGDYNVWKEERGGIVSLFDEMVGLLEG